MPILYDAFVHVGFLFLLSPFSMNSLLKKSLSVLTGLALAAPLAVGIAFAEESEQVAPTTTSMTQACVTARIATDDALIAAKNALTAKEVAAIQAHKAALAAAGALTDVTAKKAAFKKAETDLRTAMKTATDAFKTTTKTSMDAVKTACGKPAMGIGEGRMMMEGHNKGVRGLKPGFMNKMMKMFNRGKAKGSQSSSSSIAQ